MAGRDQALLRRCFDFELERDVQVSERVESYEWGRAFLSPTLDRVWDANCLVVERAGMTAHEIVEAADDAIGSLGMQHRTVVILDEADGRRLVPDLESRGWETEPGVYMEWRRSPDREPAVEVAECRQDEIEDLRREIIRAELAEIGQENDVVVGQLLEWERRISQVDGDRWFVAPADEPASACRLLARDGVGQVEDVGTLAENRNHGLARAVTIAASRASARDRNEFTYLGALANDWPRLLYAKLGFDELGGAYDFKRKPPPRTRS